MSIDRNNQYEKMTATPAPRLVLSLGFPTTVSMLVTNIYNVADTFFVGLVGTSASAAVGIVFGLQAIFQAVGFMHGHGAGSNIARHLGKKEVDEASVYASTSFFLALAAGLFFVAIGFLCIDPICRLFGSTDTILPYARALMRFGFSLRRLR
ncbi:MATE family efflux transporter [Treponema socranskii]|uniref:MATE family efflux transporter n=1 Tax=Treponema socranskii TaxID=53419 RepID=UPI0028E8A817|nr:MATE family efflux transporter [Treponema socranskii]